MWSLSSLLTCVTFITLNETKIPLPTHTHSLFFHLKICTALLPGKSGHSSLVNPDTFQLVAIITTCLTLDYSVRKFQHKSIMYAWDIHSISHLDYNNRNIYSSDITFTTTISHS